MFCSFALQLAQEFYLVSLLQVKPVLNRLKYTLITLGASLFVCALLLINLEGGQKGSYLTPTEPGGEAIPGVYNDDSAKSFEPDAFCGEPSPPWLLLPRHQFVHFTVKYECIFNSIDYVQVAIWSILTIRKNKILRELGWDFAGVKWVDSPAQTVHHICFINCLKQI